MLGRKAPVFKNLKNYFKRRKSSITRQHQNMDNSKDTREDGIIKCLITFL